MYYVYIHKRKDNNQAFYVGSGTGFRSSTKSNRGKEWHEVTKQAGGYVPEILSYFTTKEEALEMESYLIATNPYGWNLCNKLLPIIPQEIPIDLLNAVIYDESSLTCLTWKIQRPNFNLSNARKAGDCVGTLNGDYFRFRWGNKRYSVHRVVWALWNGVEGMNNMVVNHIDGNKLNNKIDNLELVTQKENSRKYQLLCQSTLS